MSQKVLLVDDCLATHGLIRTRLRDEAVELECALDGETGMALALSFNPDLILLDVEMPHLDGFEVCRLLKQDVRTMHTPVIFLTGATSTAEKIRGLELGAVDYITKPFDPAELRARVRASLRMKYLMDLLSRKAMIDGLTGLWNRAYFDARMVSELSIARRNGRALACIMADVDRFKLINDTYGHPFGDEVLRSVAQVIMDRLRTEDTVCRYGGEEFAILAPDTTAEGAALLAERLREAVEQLGMTRGGIEVHITLSMGVADLSGNAPPGLVELADQALYQAKQGGRNRVRVASGVAVGSAT